MVQRRDRRLSGCASCGALPRDLALRHVDEVPARPAGLGRQLEDGDAGEGASHPCMRVRRVEGDCRAVRLDGTGEDRVA